MSKYIGSPLNYVGNKLKLLDEIFTILPQNINTIVEPFCGSALVSLNSKCNNIILNDSSKYTIQLLNYFKNNSATQIIANTEKIIEEYGFTDTFHNGYKLYPTEKNEGLSRYNKEPYNKLKNSYNTDPTIEKLFVLILIGFNHYIRFNNKGIFNVPVGKVDFSATARKKTEEFANLFINKNIKILNNDFREMELYKNLTNKDLVYFDPPYLITDAPYNSVWNEELEKDLLNLIDVLSNQNIKIALSNVTDNNGLENTLLKEWMKNYTVHTLSRKYNTANYRRKNNGETIEVLITNF